MMPAIRPGLLLLLLTTFLSVGGMQAARAQDASMKPTEGSAALVAPAPAAPVAPVPDTETPGHKVVIFFQEWSARFDEASSGAIAEAADWAKQHPSTTLTVTGFADTTGSPQSNIYLSELRAERVYDELVAAGVNPGRVTRSGKGATAFQISGLESRRVEISFHES